MLFKPRDRMNELKTPKIPKISLPDSDTASLLKVTTPPATPPPIRRHSTTTATRNPTTNGDTSTAPAGRPALPQTRSCLPVARSCSTTQVHQLPAQRGGPSQKPSRASSIPIKTQEAQASPKKGDGQSLPGPSAMFRKIPEAGGGSSKTIPRKTVNFVVDSHEGRMQGDGYATDSSATWTRHTPSMRGQSELGKAEPPRSTSRREIRLGESSQMEDPTAAWSLNVTVGSVLAPAPIPPPGITRALFDGYATDVESRPRRTSTSRVHTRGSSLPIPQPPIKEEPARAEMEAPPKESTRTHRRFAPRTEEKPPGLHAKLLADVSGRAPLRFNIVFPAARPYLKTWDDIPRIVDDAELDETATETDLKTMSLQLNCEPLPPWECVIRRRKPVTCRDVFESIWREFDVELTDTEKAKIPETHMVFYQKAFKKRCKEVPVLTALEESRGLKRVDLLAGKTFFRGMTKPDPTAPWVVELQVAPRGYSS